MILGGHVTLDAGTGCVHTAPGHGREDYEVCLQYGIDIYSPLNDRGEYLDSVEFFAGLQVQKANPNVIEKVKEVGNLMGRPTLRTPIRIAGAAKSPSSSAPRPSGS